MKQFIAILLFFLLSAYNTFAEILQPAPITTATSSIYTDLSSAENFDIQTGNFRNEKTPYDIILDKNFDDENSDGLSPESGSFKIIDGKYVQQSQDAIVSKSITPALSDNFLIEFDATALSNATTIVIFLAQTADGYYTFEYSYNGAVLRKNGTEDIITASSTLGMNENVHFKITTEKNIFNVFKNNEAEPFMQSESETSFSGKAGFGSWASSVAFDNIKVSALTPGVGEYRLISEDNNEGIIFVKESADNSRISSNIKASSFLKSETGLILRSGYYFVCDGEYAYIKKKTDSGMKTLAFAPHRILSNEYYLYSAIAEGEKLTFSINNKNIVSTFDSDFKSGLSGIYKIGTSAVINNISTDILSTNISVSDENDEHLSAYAVLSEAGIMDINTSSDISAPITRTAFAEAVCKMMLLPADSPAKFADTDSPYAQSMLDSGLMSGIGNNLFGAEQKLSKTDASKVLVDAIGMKNDAVSAGGYPNGYIITAAKLGITEAIQNEFITYSDAAVMILRALEHERYENEISNPHGLSLLEALHSVKTVSGILNSNITDSSLSEDEISINGTTFEKRNTELSGRFVKCYYKEQSNNEPSIPFYIYKTKSKETTVDINDLNLPVTKNTISYYSNNKLSDIRINSKTKIIYNNEFVCTVADEMFTDITENLTEGNLTAVFNKGSNEADYLFINNCRTVIVKRVNTKENKIYDLISESDINLSKPDDLLTDEDGKTADISSVKKYDILRVYESASGKKTIAVLSPGIQIEGLIKTADEDTITLNSDIYKKNKHTFPSSIKPGNNAVIYFNNSYEAIYAEITNSSDYGYLIKSVFNEDGDEPSLLISLFSFKNGAVKLNVAEKTIFCDYSLSSTPAKSKELKSIYNAISSYTGLIRYETNKEGLITKLYLPKQASGAEPGTEDVFTMNFYKDSCQHIYNNFYSRYIVTPETKLLVVPSDQSQADKYYMKSYGSLKNDESYHIALYDCNEKYQIGVAVIYGEPTIFDSNTSIVKQVGSAANKDGDALIALHLFERGKEKIVYAKENLQCDPIGGYNFSTTHLFLSDLNPGDVISYHLDNEGYLRNYLVAFEKERKQDYYRTAIYGWWTENIPHSPLAIGYAQTTRVLEDRFFINMFWGPVSCLPSGSVMFVVYDESYPDKVYLGNLEDLDETDDVLCAWNYSTLNNILIIKKD